MNAIDRSALEAERAFLLRSIDDLDAEVAAGDLNPADHAALRDDYVARAAAVMRALETPLAATGATVASAAPRGRATKAVMTVAACLALATVAGIFLAQSSGSRGANDPLTGSLPTTVQERLEDAADKLGEGDAIGAIKAYDAILKENPDQPVALAYRGWVVRLAGLKEEGFGYVDRAVTADPSYPDAHFFRGMMLWEDKKDPAAAVVEFRLFLANNPPPSMVSLVEDALKRASAEAGIPVE